MGPLLTTGNIYKLASDSCIEAVNRTVFEAALLQTEHPLNQSSEQSLSLAVSLRQCVWPRSRKQHEDMPLCTVSLSLWNVISLIVLWPFYMKQLCCLLPIKKLRQAAPEFEAK